MSEKNNDFAWLLLLFIVVNTPSILILIGGILVGIFSREIFTGTKNSEESK